MLQSQPSPMDKFLQIAPFLAQAPGVPDDVPSGQGPSPALDGSVEQKAYQMAMQRGYTPKEWNMLDWIIDEAPTAESHWNPKAVNDSSGAAGIAQKITGWSGNYQPDNVPAQLRWLFNYLDNHVYQGLGTGVDAAYAWKKEHGWY
jgi:hypothetical protein